MKPVFGIDITENKDNEKMNSDKFIVASVSDKNSSAIDRCSAAAEDTLEAAKLPLVLRILRTVGGFGGGICILAFLSAFSDLGFVGAYKSSPLVFYVGIIGTALFVLLSVLASRKEAAVMGSDEARDVVKAVNDARDNIYRELSVPEDAESVDVLVFRYKVDNGDPIAKSLPLALTPYLNFEYKIFLSDDKLCIADLESRYEFPLCKIGKIIRVDKKISVPQWNKSTSYNSEKYKKYNLIKNNMDCIFFKPYYILEIRHGGDHLGIYFPCYELEVFERMLGITADGAEE